MISVREIDVCMPRRPVHDSCPGCPAGLGVATKVSLTHVGFGLGDVPDQTPSIQDSHQPRADQVARHLECGSFVETRSQKLCGPWALLSSPVVCLRWCASQAMGCACVGWNLASRCSVSLSPSSSLIDGRKFSLSRASSGPLPSARRRLRPARCRAPRACRRSWPPTRLSPGLARSSRSPSRR